GARNKSEEGRRNQRDSALAFFLRARIERTKASVRRLPRSHAGGYPDEETTNEKRTGDQNPAEREMLFAQAIASDSYLTCDLFVSLAAAKPTVKPSPAEMPTMIVAANAP